MPRYTPCVVMVFSNVLLLCVDDCRLCVMWTSCWQEHTRNDPRHERRASTLQMTPPSRGACVCVFVCVCVRNSTGQVICRQFRISGGVACMCVCVCVKVQSKHSADDSTFQGCKFCVCACACVCGVR